MLNEELQLTTQQEIKRLKLVIQEKDATIKAFKDYDRKRTEEYNRMVENYNLMQEQFDRFCEDISECEEIDDRTSEDFKKFFDRYYRKLKGADERTQLSQFVNEIKSRLNTLMDFSDRMVSDLKKYKADIQRFRESIEKKQKEWKK
jgi:chromosome segregation ATPase